VDYRPGLNEFEQLVTRFSGAMEGAERVDVAVAYAKASGVGHLLKVAPRGRNRAVVGLGFGLTDPPAVEQLDDAGVDVRVVAGSDALATSQFHPKLYLIEGPDRLTTFSGSANLTGSGWTTNAEQFEELTFPDPSDGADAQRERFEALWDHGTELDAMRRSGDWDLYRERARDRRRLERADQKRVIRLDADAGRLFGRLARQETRAAPGYIAITNDDWWELELRIRDQADRALFWRRNTNQFRALARGGMFFHLVKDPSAPEDLRAVCGFSVYPGYYEVGDPHDLFRRYGRMLGVTSVRELHARLAVQPSQDVGVIHLEQLTEFDRPVTLRELRAAGISFARNIVSGRSLDLREIAVILELAGLGVDRAMTRAAEETGTWDNYRRET
jgi:HKD family nuclease